MLLQPLISNSGNFIYIDNLHYLYKLASALKGNMFYADPFANKLYCSYDESYSIIETDIPYKIDKPFYFTSNLYGNLKCKQSLDNNKTFFYIPEYPFLVFPENRRGDLVNNNIGIDWEEYKLYDLMAGKEMEDILISISPVDQFHMIDFTKALGCYQYRKQYLDTPIEFQNMDKDETIMDVMANKVAQGCKLMSLRTNNRIYTFYVFKSLLGPITKADSLSIIIRQDRVEHNKFMITFRVYKKKVKLDIEGMPSNMIVDTNSFMINLS